MSQQNNQVIIYTDNPEQYSNSTLSAYVKLEFCSCPAKFCHALLEKEYSGTILDVRKVMNTPCCDRNRIFTISSGIPTIRTLEKGKRPVFLDDHENFICDCLTRKCAIPGSSCPINVNMAVEISLEDDPAMSRSVHGTIHHISEKGCTFHTDADLRDKKFLFLKIFSLKNRLPIYAGVYKAQSKAHCSCGFRVKFLDLKDDQKEEIIEAIKSDESTALE
ncbi:PilZ domain-containing protein [Desulfovibrio sp. JC010]|uniref:PilZ domain-containing protein n=1 Tax=Desulfovibrio sp. JC010 TaxID=2593641 RepID=UPI0013D7CFA5|nr:PilZ domain-containing protein [Desulfovibrio sp. JC010]